MFKMNLGRSIPEAGKYSTLAFTDIALNWLKKRYPYGPFALPLHFKAPHEPWNYAECPESMYEGMRIPEPPSLHCIGRALDSINKHILTENTVIIYTSDKGFFVGDHNYFDQDTL